MRPAKPGYLQLGEPGRGLQLLLHSVDDEAPERAHVWVGERLDEDRVAEVGEAQIAVGEVQSRHPPQSCLARGFGPSLRGFVAFLPGLASGHLLHDLTDLTGERRPCQPCRGSLAAPQVRFGLLGQLPGDEVSTSLSAASGLFSASLRALLAWP